MCRKKITMIVIFAFVYAAFGQSHWTWRNPLPTGNLLYSVVLGSKFAAVGGRGTIVTSTNGKDWALQNSGTKADLSQIIWTGTEFVVAGGDSTILSSPDGITWTSRYSGAYVYFMGILMKKNMLIALGLSGEVYTSPYTSQTAGIAGNFVWTARSSGTTNTLQAIAYRDSSASQSGLFVAVGNSGTIIKSRDAETWEPVVSGTTNMLTSIVVGNGRFVAVGASGAVVSSGDGINWTAVTVGPQYFVEQKVYWSGSQFKIFTGGDSLYVSSDGLVWSAEPATFANGLVDMGWGGKKLTIYNGDFYATPDSLVCRLAMKGDSSDLYGIAWSGTRYMAVGYSASFLTSTDGISWTPVTPHLSDVKYGIIWANNRFVAVGRSGDIIYSLDGIAWTPTTRNTFNELYSTAWTGSMFVTVGAQGIILTSSDAKTWTQRVSNGTQALRRVMWAGGKLVAVGDQTNVAVSSDGITWTTNCIDKSYNDLGNIAWSGSLYVAAGNFMPVIYTSPDAINWTKRSPGVVGGISSLVWTGYGFIANTGYGEILTSPDGITWAHDYFTARFGLRDMVCNGNTIVGVGPGGAILTSPLDNVAVKKPSPRTGAIRTVSMAAFKGAAVRIVSPMFTDGNNVAWTLYSVAGKKIQNGARLTADNKLEIPITLNSAGMYVLKTQCNGKIGEFRFVKE